MYNVPESWVVFRAPTHHKERSMNKYLTGLAMAIAVLGGGLVAFPALASKAENSTGALHVYDEANLFSKDGIEKAQKTMEGTTFDHGMVVNVQTFKEIP